MGPVLTNDLAEGQTSQFQNMSASLLKCDPHYLQQIILY